MFRNHMAVYRSWDDYNTCRVMNVMTMRTASVCLTAAGYHQSRDCHYF